MVCRKHARPTFILANGSWLHIGKPQFILQPLKHLMTFNQYNTKLSRPLLLALTSYRLWPNTANDSPFIKFTSKYTHAWDHTQSMSHRVLLQVVWHFCPVRSCECRPNVVHEGFQVYLLCKQSLLITTACSTVWCSERCATHKVNTCETQAYTHTRTTQKVFCFRPDWLAFIALTEFFILFLFGCLLLGAGFILPFLFFNENAAAVTQLVYEAGM